MRRALWNEHYDDVVDVGDRRVHRVPANRESSRREMYGYTGALRTFGCYKAEDSVITFIWLQHDTNCRLECKDYERR
jgi:hypothetical protein